MSDVSESNSRAANGRFLARAAAQGAVRAAADANMRSAVSLPSRARPRRLTEVENQVRGGK
jgi:hypothetical protein